MPLFEKLWCDICQCHTDHFIHGVEHEIKGEKCYSMKHRTCRKCRTNTLETQVYSLQYETSITEEV